MWFENVDVDHEALDCHSSVCEKQCSDTGLRASLCHMSCTPDRTDSSRIVIQLLNVIHRERYPNVFSHQFFCIPKSCPLRGLWIFFLPCRVQKSSPQTGSCFFGPPVVFRTLVDDPPCVKKCDLKHDASCMVSD